MKQLLNLFLLLLIVAPCLAQDGIHTRDQHLPCVEKHFNVYVHLTVDSVTRQPTIDATSVDDILEKVSAYFEPICMSFTACETNVISNYTFAELIDEQRIRELDVLFSKPRRLNVYVLDVIPFSHCGYSTYYGIDSEDGGSIFLEKEQCVEGLADQLAHHLGHYFGLRDTYYGSEIELVDDPNCAIMADSICDTPTDPFGLYSDSLQLYLDLGDAGAVNFNRFVRDCEFIHEMTDPNGQHYQPQVGNIMSAYPCKCGFTNQQFEKIITNYNKSFHKPY